MSEWRLKFVFASQESGDSERAIIRPIWDGCQFRPASVRLVGGDAELLLRMCIIENCVSRLISESVTSMTDSAIGKR